MPDGLRHTTRGRVLGGRGFATVIGARSVVDAGPPGARCGTRDRRQSDSLQEVVRPYPYHAGDRSFGVVRDGSLGAPRRPAHVPAWCVAAAGTGLLILGGLVTGIGQMGTYGGLLPGFVVVEVVTVLLLVAATAAMRRSSGRPRTLGAIACAGIGIWSVLTAVGMVAELLSGLAPPWLGLDLMLTALTGLVCVAAAWLAWRERRRRSPVPG
jgi:hypothetical protein